MKNFKLDEKEIKILKQKAYKDNIKIDDVTDQIVDELFSAEYLSAKNKDLAFYTLYLSSDLKGINDFQDKEAKALLGNYETATILENGRLASESFTNHLASVFNKTYGLLVDYDLLREEVMKRYATLPTKMFDEELIYSFEEEIDAIENKKQEFNKCKLRKQR